MEIKLIFIVGAMEMKGSHLHNCDGDQGNLHRKDDDDHCSAMTVTAELLHLSCHPRACGALN